MAPLSWRRSLSMPQEGCNTDMATVERTGLIEGSAEEVWAVLGDFAAISRWAPNVDHSSLMTEQIEGVGSVRRIQTGGVTVVETVETWEPGVELSYGITGLPPVIKKVTNTWRLGTSGNQTLVRLTTEIDTGPRPPQQVIAKAVGRKLGEASDQMIVGLARHLEGAE